MNIDRLNQAIEVMERAGKVDMRNWSGVVDTSICRTEAGYHECGTAACFAGWLAVSPEFQESGGNAHPNTGEPYFDNHLGSRAVIKWLEADGYAADALQLIVFGYVETNYDIDIGKPLTRYPLGSSTGLGVCDWGNWAAKDVIEALEILKEEYL